MESHTNELFKIAFNSASEGLVVVDENSKIILVNDRLLELFEYTENELIDESIERLVPMSKRKRHVTHRDGYQKDPHSRPMGKASMLLEGERKSGKVFPVEVSLNSFEVDGKRFVMGLVTDISKRVKMEEELKRAQNNLRMLNEELEMLVIKRTKALEESQDLYRSIANNFPDGVINVVDNELQYIYADGAELDKLGIDKNSLIGTSFLKRFDKEAQDVLKSSFVQMKLSGNQICHIEQNDEYYEVHFVELVASEASSKRYLIVEINITKQKTVELEQAKALQKEKELGVMKSRFVSMASHEFRTPLGAILSSASLIEKYDKTDQQVNRLKHTERIKASVSNLTDILNDFLSFEKLNENKVKLELSEVNLCELIEYAIEELSSNKKPGQSIVVHTKDVNCNLISDGKILKNVLLNLLSNGLKYSNEDGVVDVRLEERGRFLVMKVEDYGIGIPIDDQNNIFERFHRAENVSNIQGTGLGLNIVKKYIELLEGEISFSSALGKGTTFEVVIPKNLIEQR